MNPSKLLVGNKKTPDFICSLNDFQFTVECTNLNEPGGVKVERKASQYFVERFISIAKELNYNFRLRIVTSESIKTNASNIFTLAKEVIENERIGLNKYYDDRIVIYFEKTIFKRNEFHFLKDYLSKYQLIGTMDNNCLSMFLRMSDTMDEIVYNINEIGIHYDFDINKKIINTIFNKIDLGQEYEGLPKCIFCNVPSGFTDDYILDFKLIKDEVLNKIENNSSIHTVVIYNQRYLNDPDDGWGIKIAANYIKNKNDKVIGIEHNIKLHEYSSGSPILEYDELSDEEKEKVDKDIKKQQKGNN